MTDDLQPDDAPVAPDRPQDRGLATRLATDVTETGFGVDPEGAGVSHAGLRLAGLLAALVLLGLLNRWMLVVILAIVVMITLHELGHYLTAKRAGMKVTEFFLGFGPKIWSTRRGETEYGVKLIPAGAYVKIIGMTNLEEVDPADEGRTYRQKTFGQRVSVAVAGSTMHFILAFALIFVALAVVGQPAGTLDPARQDRRWEISTVSPGTGAEAIGLREGDRILSLDGHRLSTFDDLKDLTPELKGKTVPITYERDGRTITDTIRLKPFYSWYVYRVPAGSGVADAGIVADDEITAIDGTEVAALANLDDLLAQVDGDTVPVTWEHLEPGDEEPATVTKDVDVDSLVLWGREAFVGIGSRSPAKERVGALEAVLHTPREFAAVAKLSVQGLVNLLSPHGVSSLADQVGSAQDSSTATDGIPAGKGSSATLLQDGPSGGVPTAERPVSIVGIVQIGSDVGAIRPGALIALFALFNIFIGIFNLVPLLPFDGGHVAIAVYEKIQEKRLKRRRYFVDVARLLPVTYVVVLLLGLLFVSTLYLDIANPLSAS